jgi:hypothetical protein
VPDLPGALRGRVHCAWTGSQDPDAGIYSQHIGKDFMMEENKVLFWVKKTWAQIKAMPTTTRIYIKEFQPVNETPKIKKRGIGFTKHAADKSKVKRLMAKQSRRINRRK